MSGQQAATHLGYEIKIHGHLDPRRLSWFEGLTITPQPEGHSLLTLYEDDQTSLQALLKTLSDLGVSLISVSRLPEPH